MASDPRTSAKTGNAPIKKLGQTSIGLYGHDPRVTNPKRGEPRDEGVS